MGILRRAFISVDKNWRKSAVLFILFFIISNLIIGSFLVLNSIDKTIEYFYRNMPNNIIISEGHGEVNGIPIETLDAIRDLPYVRSSWYGAFGIFDSRTLSPFQGLEESPCLRSGVCSFATCGLSNPNLLEIDEGIFELTAGRMFLPEEIESLHYVAVVSQAFADENGLTVGDMMPFEIMAYDIELLWYLPQNFIDYVFFGTAFEVEIIGLFALNQSMAEGLESSAISEAYNTIFAPNDLVAHVNEMKAALFRNYFTETELENLFIPSNKISNALLSLYDFRDYGVFYEESRALLPEHATISTVEHLGLGDVGASMSSMHAIMNSLLYGAIGGCILIVGLTMMLFFRDRRHEIGVYISLGETKLRVVKQLLIETTLIAGPSFLSSFFVGNMIADRLNSWLLLNHLMITSSDTSFSLVLYANTITMSDVLEVHQIGLDFPASATIVGILFLTLLLSTLIPIFYILRLQPKEILMIGGIGTSKA